MKKLLVIALVFALSLSVVFAQAAKEETKVQTASSDFVYDGNGPITDLDGQHLSILAQNSYYTTVDLRQAPIIPGCFNLVKMSLVNIFNPHQLQIV